jgi:type I restriction enzyme R subunit
MPMSKKDLSEQEIRTRYITPAITQKAGWKTVQIREEFTLGKIHVRGKSIMRGKRKKADYILFYKPNIPLAIVEAKDNKHSVGSGMQQALEYAEILDIPFVYSSNGDGFVEHDRTCTVNPIERVLGLDEFPTPEDLWQRYKAWKQISSEEEKIITQNYYHGEKQPRYYQRVAINRAIEAIAKGQDRILLVMATGTGKTYTAFQIMWRLWKARKKKRILFLADRNILVDQAKTNDFKQFGQVMTKITHRQIDKSYEVYLALYQAVSGTEEAKNIYKQFSPDFFDLIFVDECHRGSAAEDSAWREILEYFSSATQIGLTATPKETVDVSNIDYFGEPVYTYSLKQGIEDGFLAPYKVIRYQIDKDIEGWRPKSGQRDLFGYEIPDEVFYGPDFDKTIVIEERTQLIADLVSDYLRETGRMQKTIIFCRDIAHAEEMRRALINANPDQVAKNPKYVMRITGDSQEGKNELDNFIDPQEPYPVLVTTSKLLNTGVDTQTVKLIVLDTIINSMTEFKQIIGRGSRVRPDADKFFYTIMDFRNATRLFQDPDFDGEPVSVYDPQPGDPPVIPIPPETPEFPGEDEDDDDGAPRKLHVKDVEVELLSKRVQYLGKDGHLITESYTDFGRKNLQERYPSLDAFLLEWYSAERKQAVIEALVDEGIYLDMLAEEVGQDLDPFDLICHIAFDQKPLTRSERSRNVRQKPEYFEKYGETARNILEVLLEKYADQGLETLEKVIEGKSLTGLLSLPPFNQMGRPVELVRAFGGKDQFQSAVRDLENYIYKN